MASGIVKPRTLKGFRDYLPAADIPRQAMLRRIVDVFEGFGFGPLTTPAIEYSEVLLGKYGDEGDKLLYRFLDNGERDVALRYDLTVPLARVVAQHRPSSPFRRYQIAPVWRAEKPSKGRFREFMQCDVDIVGEPSMRADAECMMVGLAVLTALEVPGFVMRVNNRKVLDGMMARIGAADAERVVVLRGVDKLPKIGKEGVKAELLRETSLSGDAIESLFAVLETPVTTIAELEALSDLFDDTGKLGVAELIELLEIVQAAGYGGQVEVDLSIARGLDYYTGTIYETFVTGREDFGSVMSGGRYDELLGMFLKTSVPAVGISLGVDRLLSLLVDLELVQERQTVANVYVALADDEGYGEMAKLSRLMREQGLRVEQSMAAKKLGKQFKAANSRGISWVVLAGADERAAGTVSIKNMTSGEQSAVPIDEAPKWLAQRVEAS